MSNMFDTRLGVSTGSNVSVTSQYSSVGGNSESLFTNGICQLTDNWRARANARPKVVTIKQVKEIRTWAH